MIAIVDYGVGNQFSLVCSFRAIGVEAKLTSDRKEIESAEKIVLQTDRLGCADWLNEQRISYETLDEIYDGAEDFDEFTELLIKSGRNADAVKKAMAIVKMLQ